MEYANMEGIDQALLVQGEEGRDLIVSEQQEGGQPSFHQTLVSVEP